MSAIPQAPFGSNWQSKTYHVLQEITPTPPLRRCSLPAERGSSAPCHVLQLLTYTDLLGYLFYFIILLAHSISQDHRTGYSSNITHPKKEASSSKNIIFKCSIKPNNPPCTQEHLLLCQHICSDGFVAFCIAACIFVISCHAAKVRHREDIKRTCCYSLT